MTYVYLPRPEVPRPIAIVRDFVNTTDHESGTDELTTPAELTGYLVREGLLDGTAPAGEEDLAIALRLRSGLRSALELNHVGESAPLPELSSALGELPIGLTWAGDTPALGCTAPGVRGALARIGLAAHDAATDGTWHRLKICASGECQWAYYDHSKNRSRNWCEYCCGNKMKTRAYRERKKAAAGEPSRPG